MLPSMNDSQSWHVGFLQKLQTYAKDHIPPEVIVKTRPYMDNPDFEPEVVKKASRAAYGLVSWVRAMEAYDRSGITATNDCSPCNKFSHSIAQRSDYPPLHLALLGCGSSTF